MIHLCTTVSICTLISVCLNGIIAPGPLFRFDEAGSSKSSTCFIHDLQNEAVSEAEESQTKFDEVEFVSALSSEEHLCPSIFLGYESLSGLHSGSVPVDSQRGPPSLGRLFVY